MNMKTFEKVAAGISCVVFIALIVYLIYAGYLFSGNKLIDYIFLGIVIGVPILILFGVYIRGVFVTRRVQAFKKLAQEYNLKHEFSPFKVFVPYGWYSVLSGTVHGKNIKIQDEYVRPSFNASDATVDLAGGIATEVLTSSSTGISPTNGGFITTITIEGEQEEQILDFLSISEIQKMLRGL